MTDYKLSSDDVRAIHESVAQGSGELRELMRRLAAKFPLPEPPKPTRYRTIPGVVVGYADSETMIFRRKDGSIMLMDATMFESIFESIPDEPAMAPDEDLRHLLCCAEIDRNRFKAQLEQAWEDLERLRTQVQPSAKVPDIFKRGDWVRVDSREDVGIVLDSGDETGEYVVHSKDGDVEYVMSTCLEHTDPPL